jgi:hypothetical protein
VTHERILPTVSFQSCWQIRDFSSAHFFLAIVISSNDARHIDIALKLPYLTPPVLLCHD